MKYWRQCDIFLELYLAYGTRIHFANQAEPQINKTNILNALIDAR